MVSDIVLPARATIDLFLVFALPGLLALLALAIWQAGRARHAGRAVSALESRLADADTARADLVRQWDALARAVPAGVLRVDASDRVLYTNETARRLLGLADPPESAGHEPLLRDLAWGFDLHALTTQLRGETGATASQIIVRGERAFEVRAVALDTAQGGAILSIAEVTELQRLGRARREFVANISHELRTPVTSLQLLFETMNDEVVANKPLLDDLLLKARAQVDLLKQLTDELMDLALIESGQAPIRLVNVVARDLIVEALAPLRPQAERKGIAIETQVPPDLQILADPQAVRKVLANLTHNAIKFTPDGGRIIIRAVWLNEGADVQVSVHDTGVGIPADDLPRIFERFYKVDRARTRASGDLRGTGLGLAIAKHIVEAHGGQLWAESEQGKGSAFFITLPSGE